MKNFKDYVLEDAQYDIEVRKEAKEVFDALVEYLKKNKIYFDKHLQKSKEKFKRDSEQNKERATIGFRIKAEDFMDGYQDLKINIIGADEEERGSFYTWKRWFKFFHHIYLNILEMDDTFEDFLKKLKDGFDSTFLHEFIHYKDSKRLKLQDPRKVAYPSTPERKDYNSDYLYELAKAAYNDEYYSNALELNAFFQKILYEFDKEYESFTDSEKEEIEKDFKSFLKKVVPLLKRYMVSYHMSEKTKNRIIKRFYKYWDEIHSTK